MQGVLVQRQHEDNEDKESVKNREEEHTLVSKFLQIVLDFRLEQKQVKFISEMFRQTGKLYCQVQFYVEVLYSKIYSMLLSYKFCRNQVTQKLKHKVLFSISTLNIVTI